MSPSAEAKSELPMKALRNTVYHLWSTWIPYGNLITTDRRTKSTPDIGYVLQRERQRKGCLFYEYNFTQALGILYNSGTLLRPRPDPSYLVKTPEDKMQPPRDTANPSQLTVPGTQRTAREGREGEGGRELALPYR